MTKYIDADKLIHDLEERIYAYSEGYAEGDDNRKDAIETLLKDVKYQLSLQQKQESVAERFARIIRGNLIGIDKEVQQKFEQLYFEVTGNKMYGGYND